MALKWVLRTFLSVLIKRPGRKFHIKFSLNVLVNLKIRALNKYKNRSYNRNQRVHSFLAEPVKTLNCVNGSYSRYEWSHLPIIQLDLDYGLASVSQDLKPKSIKINP